jgi:hypothetical protein
MFVRNSAVVFSVYVVGAFIVVAFVGLMFFGYDEPQNMAVLSPERAQRVRTRPIKSRPIASRFESVALRDTQQRIEKLQNKLEKTSGLLAAKTKVLHDKNAECRALEDELNDSLGFALALLADEPGDRNVTAKTASKLEADLSTLKTELRRAQKLREQHVEQLEQLRLDLMEADLELADLRQRAEREIAALAEEKLVLEVATGNAMLQTGEAATGPLVDLLRHDRAEIRTWAAAVLGDMGPTARAAIEPLTSLLDDPDERVAKEARRAIASIEP